MDNNNNYVGISDHRISHMLSVARKCYSLAKEKYKMSEEEAQKYFVMGLLHDIGYEFSNKRYQHPFVGADILESMTLKDINEMINAIRHHGKCLQYEYTMADYILNEADLTIDSQGNEIDIDERLKVIKKNYGENSRQYNNADEMSKRLKEGKIKDTD